MKRKLKKPFKIGLSILAVALAFSTYVHTHPLVFNESFWGHAHCIVGGGLALGAYASEHSGRFPYHTNGYGDALVLVDQGWDAVLTGPGYDTKVFERVRKTGEDAPENEFGRVYVQSLGLSDNPEIAILFDKLPTPGGDHCHLFRRLFAPLRREVYTIGSSRPAILEAEWPEYSKKQIELLVAAGITRTQAEMYYAEKPRQ